MSKLADAPYPEKLVFGGTRGERTWCFTGIRTGDPCMPSESFDPFGGFSHEGFQPQSLASSQALGRWKFGRTCSPPNWGKSDPARSFSHRRDTLWLHAISGRHASWVSFIRRCLPKSRPKQPIKSEVSERKKITQHRTIQVRFRAEVFSRPYNFFESTLHGSVSRCIRGYSEHILNYPARVSKGKTGPQPCGFQGREITVRLPN